MSLMLRLRGFFLAILNYTQTSLFGMCVIMREFAVTARFKASWFFPSQLLSYIRDQLGSSLHASSKKLASRSYTAHAVTHSVM